ncbi:MAG: Asp-tRNA(Asn)/Glu-tRNA(Gln) amidotransferase subunit GatC [Patescibacteria group bacterium]
MKLSPAEVKKIAILARLNLSVAENEILADELSSILDYVEQLQNVNTETVAATNQTTGLVNITRQDEVNYNYPRQEMLDCALDQAADHLKVKNVFKS